MGDKLLWIGLIFIIIEVWVFTKNPELSLVGVILMMIGLILIGFDK